MSALFLITCIIVAVGAHTAFRPGRRHLVWLVLLPVVLVWIGYLLGITAGWF